MFVNKNFSCELKKAEVSEEGRSLTSGRLTRVRFMCSVLVSAQGLYCFGTWIKERVTSMCSVLVSAHGLLFQHID